MNPEIQKTTSENTQTDTWFLSGQVDPSGPVRRVVINTSPFIIGRRSEASLCLDNSGISKEHAELFLKEDQLFLRDLGSTNGTYLGGEKISDPIAVHDGDLIQIATIVLRVGCDRKETMGNTLQENVCDQALAMMQFDRLINDGEVLTFGQPIVRLDTKEIIAFEILGRSRLFGLKTPIEMFDAALQLNQVAELSELFRRRGVTNAVKHNCNINLFLNTHPVEVGSERLVKSLDDLRSEFADQEITLEIHEAAVTNTKTMTQLRKALTNLDIKLAFDDFGVGRARLVELSELRPDYLKFDMKLTRHMHKASEDRQRVVAALVKMVQEMDIVCLAEGVETPEGHEALRRIGFELGQGFYYCRPAPFSKLIPTGSDTDTV